MSIPMNGESYVLSLEVIMDDDENQTQFGNLDMGCLDMGCLDTEQRVGHIHSWDFRDHPSSS